MIKMHMVNILDPPKLYRIDIIFTGIFNIRVKHSPDMWVGICGS